ncbi:MAG: threonine synthase [Bacteroidales bacterium]|nr:threonine synthase [Bacteroidales bacterium]
MAEEKVRYYSTNLNSPEVSFREALLQGLAPDRGLYFPVTIPKIDKNEVESFRSLNYSEIAFNILSRFIGDEVNHGDLEKLCRDAYNFEIPVERIEKRKYILRLDRGPTASFKDFAARMMGRLMQYFTEAENRELVILTATSGDTGSAVANAFYGLENIKVIILYPASEVTDMQRKQMTTLGRNIQVVAVKGKFDDCQRMVKKAFTDPELETINFSSANSINIGRLLPQSVYYFWSWSRLAKDYYDQAVFSVPSGNFGNLMGGIIAREMGLPVRQFVVSTNENDEFPVYLDSGKYKILNPSRNCISSAMNVGHPSNMARIFAVYGGVMNEAGEVIKEPDLKKMRSEMYAVSVSDKQTKETIMDCYRRYGVLLEPHGAVAWRGLTIFLNELKDTADDNQLCISLETAHPAKFPSEIEEVLNIKPDVPEPLKAVEQKQEEYVILENDYDIFRDFILSKYKL